MVRILLKKQLAEIFRSYFYDAKKNRARSRVAVTAYLLLFAVLMVGVLGGIFTYLSVSLCAPLLAADLGWLYFTLMGLIAILLGAFGSVFNTYSGLYLAKDNDLLLSMPIPTSAIMTARLLSVYLMGLLYSGIVIVPAVIVYLLQSPGSAAFFGGLLLIVLISVFVLTLSCLLGWAVARISLRLRHKSLVVVLASLLFFGGYYFVYFRAQALLSELLANAAVYGEKIRGAAYPLYLFGRVGVGDLTASLLVSAAVLALFAGMWALLSRSFLKIATASGQRSAGESAARSRAVRPRTVDGALLAKELGRFTASPNYMLNCGMGILMLAAAGIALLWRGSMIPAVLAEIFPDDANLAPVLLCSGICLLASMNDIAAPSVSLEGKSLWIAQSLPVTPWQVLRAKLRLQLLLTGIPVLLCLLCGAIAFALPAAESLLCAAVVLLFTAFSALFGLFLGVKMPNLTWTNELAPIKQSACVAIALFVGWVYSMLLLVGYLLAGERLGACLYLTCCAALTLALCVPLLLWLRKKGARTFAAL